MIKKLVFIVIFGLLTIISTEAQILETGLQGGITYYNGDWNPGVPYNMVKPVGGLVARYSEGTRWAFALNVNSGMYATDDRFARDVKPLFPPQVRDSLTQMITNSISTASIVAEFNFYDFFTGSEKDFITPYIFGGIGMMWHNAIQPITDSLSPIYDFPKNLIEDSFKNSIILPFGVGIKYSISYRFGLSAEWRMIKTFTDELDIQLENRTAPYNDMNNNDWLNFTTISLTYKFVLAKKFICNDNPKVKY